MVSARVRVAPYDVHVLLFSIAVWIAREDNVVARSGSDQEAKEHDFYLMPPSEVSWQPISYAHTSWRHCFQLCVCTTLCKERMNLDCYTIIPRGNQCEARYVPPPVDVASQKVAEFFDFEESNYALLIDMLAGPEEYVKFAYMLNKSAAEAVQMYKRNSVYTEFQTWCQDHLVSDLVMVMTQLGLKKQLSTVFPKTASILSHVVDLPSYPYTGTWLNVDTPLGLVLDPGDNLGVDRLVYIREKFLISGQGTLERFIGRKVVGCENDPEGLAALGSFVQTAKLLDMFRFFANEKDTFCELAIFRRLPGLRPLYEQYKETAKRRHLEEPSSMARNGSSAKPTRGVSSADIYQLSAADREYLARFDMPAPDYPTMMRLTMPDVVRQHAAVNDDMDLLKVEDRTVAIKPFAHAAPVEKSPPAQVVEETKDAVCTVCMDGALTHLFAPCGHMCLCKTCATTQFKAGDQCPVCRTVSVSIVQLFKV